LKLRQFQLLSEAVRSNFVTIKVLTRKSNYGEEVEMHRKAGAQTSGVVKERGG